MTRNDKKKKTTRGCFDSALYSSALFSISIFDVQKSLGVNSIQASKSGNCCASPTVDNIRAYMGGGGGETTESMKHFRECNKKKVCVPASLQSKAAKPFITTALRITTPTLSAAQPAQTSSFPSYPTPCRIPVKLHTHYTT